MNNPNKPDEQFGKVFQKLQQDYNVLITHSKNRIAELDKTIESLQKSNEHFNATINALPIILFELDSSGRIFDFHAPHHEMLFVKPEMFLGKTIYETAKNKEIIIEVNVPSDLMIHTDMNILQGIIRNLTNNAVKFTQMGGGRLLYLQIQIPKNRLKFRSKIMV